MGIKEKILICICAAAAIFAIPEIIPHFYQRVAWDHYTDEGRRLILFGEADKAVDYYKTQIQDVLKAGGSKDPRYIAVLEGLALSFQKQEMYKSADDQFNEALATLHKSWVPDRLRIGQVLELQKDMYLKHPEVGNAKAIQQQITALNPWWQWFWTGFTIVFIAEALYLGHVISKPGDFEWEHLTVEYGTLYTWSIFIGTIGMSRGMWMNHLVIHEAVMWAMAISFIALPSLLGSVLALARYSQHEDARRFLAPTNKTSTNSSGSSDYGFQHRI